MNQGFTAGLSSNNMPTLSNSTSVGFGEVNNVKQNMNNSSSFGMGMTSGMMPTLSNSTSIGQSEQQKLKQKVQNSNSSVSSRFY